MYKRQTLRSTVLGPFSVTSVTVSMGIELSLIHISQVSIPLLHLVLPLGISFYTLEAISYLVDVYYHKIDAEHNLGLSLIHI